MKPQQMLILVNEFFPLMMPALVADIIVNFLNLGFTYAVGCIAGLPVEPLRRKVILIYKER